MNDSGVASKKAQCANSKKISITVLGIALALSLFCLTSFAQLNLGSIAGAITDQTGGAIVGATVNIIDVARGISRPLISDGAGEYSAPSLTPGTYTVHVEATGFRSVDREDVLVQVGQAIRVDVTMQPGQQTQTITVTGDLPMVDTSNAQLGGMLENMSVEELPVDGGNYQYMLQDRPGVVMVRSEGPGPITSNGTASGNQVWMFDGLYDQNLWASGASIAGGSNNGPDAPSVVPLDAIQEVSMVELPKAEYGWKFGAHVNVGLKSGTNNLHGTAYAFGRDTGLDAKNPFLLGTEPKAPLAYERFGASVGGPIKKNKWFFFLSYEGSRFNVGVPRLAVEPTYADLTGTSGAVGNSIPDAIYDILHNTANTNGTIPSALSLNLAGCTALVPAGSVTPAGTLSAAQVAVLRTESPAQLASGCNGAAGLFGGHQSNSTTYVTDFPEYGTSDNGIGKIDYHPNDHNALNFEGFTGGGPDIIAGSAIEPYWLGSIYTKANVIRGVWIFTPNSSWVNDFRFGYDFETLPQYNYECQHPGIGPNYSALGFVPGNFPCPPNNPVYGGFPVTTVSGFGNLGNTEGIFQDETMHYFAFNDSVSYTRGKHQFKFGGELRLDFFEGEGSAGGRGTLSFGTVAPFTGATALEDFMAGVPSTGEILVGQQYDAYYFNQGAAFVQDDWRVLPKLTLNLGIRWEYTGSLWAVGNHMGNFNPSAPGVGPTGLIQDTDGHNVYKQSPLDFAPRIGLAYDIFGNGKTVVRAGFNMIYATLPGLTSIASSAGAYLEGIPTGFTFYNPNGSTFAGPGNIQSGAVNLATAQLPWAINVPVFQATATSQLQCGDGVPPVNPVAGAPASEPAPCYLQAIQPDLGHQGQVYYRTLGVQHAFSNNLSWDIAYVGSHGSHLLGTTNINTPLPGTKNTAANGYIEQARRPYNAEYPYYGVINYEAPFQTSDYDGLQTSVTQRVTRGLNFTVGYTLQQYLDDATIPLHPGNPQLDFGDASPDVHNILTFSMTYLVPGRKSPGQLLEGWKVNTSVVLQSGLPINADDTTNDLSGTGQLNDRWTLAGNKHDFKIGGPGPTPCWGVMGSSFSRSSNCTTVAAVTNMPALCQSAAAAEVVNTSLPAGTASATGLAALTTIGCYMMGASAIVPPAQGTYGTMSRDELYYEGFHNWDLSATKAWKFKERYSAEFRADFFNVLNRTTYSAPSANLAAPASFGETASTPDINNPVIGNGPRKIQLGLKLFF